ncbi:hypothetical protein CAter10_1513 [Collimonas arenae]|nr:hypothetical protein CAter10_1513 [Collimonas arenae]
MRKVKSNGKRQFKNNIKTNTEKLNGSEFFFAVFCENYSDPF